MGLAFAGIALKFVAWGLRRFFTQTEDPERAAVCRFQRRREIPMKKFFVLAVLAFVLAAGSVGVLTLYPQPAAACDKGGPA
jgi:hypothetical protein